MWCCLVQFQLFCWVTLLAREATLSQGLHSSWLDQADKDITFPTRVKQDGSPTTDLKPSDAGTDVLGEEGRHKRGTTEKVTVVYHLSGFGVHYELQVTPSEELLSPSSIVQTVQLGSTGREEVLTEYIDNEGCHLSGWVRTGREMNTTMWGQAAVSVCDGNMTGVMKMHDHHVFIEVPSDEETSRKFGQAHILYRRSVDAKDYEDKTECHVSAADAAQGDDNTHSTRSEQAGKGRTTRQAPDNNVLYVETLVAVDTIAIGNRQMTSRQRRDYILSLMNIANMLWKNRATGFDVRFVVLRIMFLKATPSGLTLSVNSVALMKSFCNWQNTINNDNDSSSTHHDYAVLLTGNEMCSTGFVACRELGRAYLTAMCRSEYACQVSTDAGIRTGFVIAHEAGHSFDMPHDGDNNNNCGLKKGIMAPQVSSHNNLFQWSRCSQWSIRNFLQNPRAYACLLDRPIKRDVKRYKDRWIGSRYDIDQQCSLQLQKKTTMCRWSVKEEMCEALWCQDGSRCTTVYIPAADGTVCGVGKVCVRGQCVIESQKDNYIRLDAPVHGGWSDWSSLSSCSRTCGGGLQYRERQCNRPKPSRGGRICEGRNYSVGLCSNQPCPNDPIDPRERECQSRTDANGNPLQPYYHSKQPCAFYCYNTATRRPQRLATPIEDATECNPTTQSNDRCFRGQCQKFGCNYRWNSTAVKDSCGVCQGTGKTCRVRSGTYENSITSSGYHLIVTIPSQATNILAEEISFLSDLYLAVKVRSSRGNRIILNRNRRTGAAWQTIKAAGTVMKYSRPGYDREAIRIEGPLQNPIDILVLFTRSGVTLSNPNIKWQYSMPLGGSDPGSGVPSYVWKKRVELCSRTCRGGTQQVTYSCTRTNGGLLVHYSFCDSAAVSRTHTVACNSDVPCGGATPSYKWRTGKWGACSATCGQSQQRRDLRCYDETSARYIDNSKCGGTAPASVRRCSVLACPQKPINGGWTDWEKSGHCSKTCGSGVQLETRTCTNPRPRNGGKGCVGATSRHLCCNTHVCRSGQYAIDEFTAQCRKHHPLSAAVFSAADLSSCEIKCQLKNGRFRMISAEDASRCHLRSSNRCLKNTCLPVGCDCVYNSTRTPTACGLCSDDSAKCITINTQYRIQHGIARDYHIVDVPIHAYRIRIVMNKGTVSDAVIVMRSLNSKRLASSHFSHSSPKSVYAFGGKVSYVPNAARNRESWTVFGPLQEDLEIFLVMEEYLNGRQSPTIDVSYIISNQYKQRAAELNHLYGWTLSKTGCSVTCGVGMEKWVAQCARKDTGASVDNSQCSSDYKPLAVEGIQCRMRNCPRFIWQPKSWSQCSVSCGSGLETRTISCVSEETQLAVREELCDTMLRPPIVRNCLSDDCIRLTAPFQWQAKGWKPCSVTCGQGTQRRSVKCIQLSTGGSKNVKKCSGMPKPADSQVCHVGVCPRSTAPTPALQIIRVSLPQFVWSPEGWKACAATCGIGFQRREVKCIDRETGQDMKLVRCDSNSKPGDKRVCFVRECPTDSLKQTCATEPGFCPAVKSESLCAEPNFVGKCCKSCP